MKEKQLYRESLENQYFMEDISSHVVLLRGTHDTIRLKKCFISVIFLIEIPPPESNHMKNIRKNPTEGLKM